jgi:hypothetical protein
MTTVKNNNNKFCCECFRFAFEVEQGIRYDDSLGDNIFHYYYLVVPKKDRNDEGVKPCIISYCNFCGTNLTTTTTTKQQQWEEEAAADRYR